MESLASFLERLPLIAILRGIRPEDAPAIAEVLVEAGFCIIEVPLNSPRPLESIRRLDARFAERALIGAGTVLTPAQVAEVSAAGGRLIVSPNAEPRVVEAAKRAGAIALPGFATPTEAFRVLEAGADGLKLFPAEANPPAVLRALKAVLPWDVPVLPVGSIRPDNMAQFRDAGAAGFGVGGSLYRPGDTPALVASRAREFVAAWRSLAPAGEHSSN